MAANEGRYNEARRLVAEAMAVYQRLGQEPMWYHARYLLGIIAYGQGDIAAALSVSRSTVKTHIAALMRKLNARNRVEIVMWAYETRRVDA